MGLQHNHWSHTHTDQILAEEIECDNGDTEVAGEGEVDSDDGTWNGGLTEAVFVSKQWKMGPMAMMADLCMVSKMWSPLYK